MGNYFSKNSQISAHSTTEVEGGLAAQAEPTVSCPEAYSRNWMNSPGREPSNIRGSLTEHENIENESDNESEDYTDLYNLLSPSLNENQMIIETESESDNNSEPDYNSEVENNSETEISNKSVNNMMDAIHNWQRALVNSAGAERLQRAVPTS